MNTEPPLLPQLNVSGPEPVTRIRVQDGDTKVIHQACLFKIHGRIIAAFATSVGVQLWDNDAQQKLYSWPSDPLVAKPGTSSAASAHKGLAVVQTENDACVLCVGNDFGSIHVFAVSDASSVQHSHDISHHQAPISTLAAGQALSSSLLASGDDHGALAVFKAASACNFQVLHKWEGVGIPCVSTAVKGTTLVGAFYDGSVRLHSLVSPESVQPTTCYVVVFLHAHKPNRQAHSAFHAIVRLLHMCLCLSGYACA